MTCATGTMCQHKLDCKDHNCPGRPDHELLAQRFGVVCYPAPVPQTSEQSPPKFELTTDELWDRFVHRLATTGLLVITAIVIGMGAWMWLR